MPVIEIDKKGIVGDLLGGGDDSSTAQAQSTQAAKTAASFSTDKDATTSTTAKAGKTDSASSASDKANSTSADSKNDKASSTSSGNSSATSANTAASTNAKNAASSATSKTSDSSAASSTPSSTTSAISSETSAESASSSGTATSNLSTQSASDSVSSSSDSAKSSTTASATELGDNVSASLSSSSAPSTASVAAVAANASANTGSSTIFNPDNKLFPLAMVLVSLAGLFVIVTTVVLFIRVFGWNKRRRTERSAIPSYIGSDPSFEPVEPKRFETITNNIASTSPGQHDNYNYVNYPPNASAVNEPPARPVRAQYVAASGPTPNPYDDYYDEKPQHMGSPVPSFNTQRGYDRPPPTGVYDYGAQYQQPSVPQRSNTKSSAYSSSSGGSMGAQMMGQNPSQAGYARRYSGSGQSFKSVASSRAGRSNGGRLEKERY
ncbi:hypothetical protein L202_02241 [Cryptococcus amylolentus CBS 6039]|uniref:Uncharacterized protein n=2 Tax=Cryptococcus amylolentus TaxID=104669 RepID=A0A1E3HZY1_9TREE|nr:hypothetical protein L202_02241 [Cryptococcus amylolentus CBS 6039]ODN81892.1 hypothetical protein L202_02241 [Cryptococcus amylolentus CBS 6039]ODO09952.1 hypothetical protein I350_02175 [Cryptococcus amylolentus CBS 6273]